MCLFDMSCVLAIICAYLLLLGWLVGSCGPFLNSNLLLYRMSDMSYRSGDHTGSSGSSVRIFGDGESAMCLAITGNVVGSSWAKLPAKKSGIGFGVNSFGPIVGSEKMGDTLPKNNRVSKINSEDYLHWIRRAYSIPEWASLHAPDTSLRPNWDVEGMVCMYELPFTLGLRLPLPRLVVELCNYYRISPSQLMPNTWRILMAAEVFAERKGFDINIYDVLYAYQLGETRIDKGRYQFNSRSDAPILITNLPEDRTKWKEKYFFISVEALGIQDGYKVPSAWSKPRRINGSLPVICGLPERAQRFYSFSEEDRDWRVILSEDNLRGSSLWCEIPVRTEGIVHPPSRARFRIALVARALEILRQGREVEGFPLLFELTPAERVFVDQAMADLPFYKPKGSRAAYERIQQKKKKVMVSSSEEPTTDLLDTVSLPSPVGSGKRSASSVVSDQSGGSTIMKFPVDAAAYTPCAPQLEDRARLDAAGYDSAMEAIISHSFLGTRGILYLGDKVKELEKQLTKLRAEQVDCRKENRDLKKCKVGLDNVIKGLQEQMASHEQDARKLHEALENLEAVSARVRDLESEIVQLRSMMEDVGLEAEVLTRGEIYQEFRDGKSGEWDIDRCILEMENLLQQRAEKAAAIQARAAAEAKELTDTLGRLDAEDAAGVSHGSTDS
ncbi:uncharacterized protein LOC130999533 [Salvia miltiorrhiza]|uniref:uncharacterized protein LOC130999533 n=1 Tax=Salvia miltiorrhiza TaxID=226208 RepID=UPI0025AD08D1|nr:uncharacterized protein LOC130999533 [Salvia miltiorrhiza]